MAERTITIGGLGKTFAVTGWRLGYACALGPLATALRTVHDFLTICAPTPLQHAAAAAMALPESYYEQLLREYELRRTRMMAILREHGFAADPPEGAYYVLTDLGPLAGIGTDHDVARHMIKQIGVAVVPGSSFYGTPGLGRNTIRWAYAKKLDTLDQVATRLRERLPRA